MYDERPDDGGSDALYQRIGKGSNPGDVWRSNRRLRFWLALSLTINLVQGVIAMAVARVMGF